MSIGTDLNLLLVWLFYLSAYSIQKSWNQDVDVINKWLLSILWDADPAFRKALAL